jgi:hypothetical protein
MSNKLSRSACPLIESLEPRLLLSGDALFTVELAEMDGVTTADYPVTLSLAFKEGDVATHVTAEVDGAPLATQTDVKATYDDGSVQHALVSFVLPQLDAGQVVNVDIVDGGTNADTGQYTVSELLASDFEAEMALNVDGTDYSVSARDLMAGIGTPDYWASGDIVSEMLIRDFDVNIEDQLNIQFYVRKYEGWDGFRVETVVENVWAEYRGNVTYDFDLNLGLSSPQTVLSRTDFTHNFNARWHRTFWTGPEPSEIEVRYDIDYLISTGLLPNYDTSLTVSESTIEGAYSGWQSTDHDLMEPGFITTYFGTTGGRQEIGLYPTWAVRYLLSMDNRMREITLNCGDVGGYVPIHLRESDPARNNYQRIISVDDRPSVWVSRWNHSGTDPADALPAPIGSTDTIWSVDKAHQASFATIPYLVTGDYYYYEEMAFWGAWNIADTWHSSRQYEKGIIEDQIRGEAWAIRNLADAANLAPDLHAADKAYFNDKINNTLTEWAADRIGTPDSYPSVHYWGTGNRRLDPFIDEVTYYTSPWQEDMIVIVLSHMEDIGFDTRDLIEWQGETTIDRFHHPDFNWYRGPSYHLPVLWDPQGDGSSEPIPTWLQVEEAFLDQPGPTEIKNPDYAFSYNAIAWAALAHLTDMPYGQVTWQWLDDRVGFKHKLDSDPTWAILPPSDDGDVTPPADVTDLAAGTVTDGSVELTWTSVGDDGHEGEAMVYDIRYSTDPIDETNWGSATQVDGEPFPVLAGATETFVIDSVAADTGYYFALKVADNRMQWSGLSNVISATTLPDPVAPDLITDLAATGQTLTTVSLAWTAVGDDGMVGAAEAYDLRYLTEPLTEANWATATPVAGLPVPLPAGSNETFTVENLEWSTTYYFGIKARDNGGSDSGLSNVVEVSTEVLPTSYTVDFETDGQHLRFDKVAGAGGLSLKDGHGGRYMEFNTGNFNHAAALYRPEGEVYLQMAMGTVEADLNIRYLDSAGHGPNAGHQGLILKSNDVGGGTETYSAMLYFSGGDVHLKVGCCDDIAGSRNYFDGPEHNGPVSTEVYDIPAQYDDERYDLGWWHMSATMSETESGDLQIDVTVTEADGVTTHELTYVDSGTDRRLGEGRIGVMCGEIFSTHGYYDNFAYAQEVRLIGDVNRDGRVDGVDLGLVSGNWGRVGGLGWGDGDLNGDDRIDGADLGLLSGNWGAEVGGETAATAGGADQTASVLIASAEPVVQVDSSGVEDPVTNTEAGVPSPEPEPLAAPQPVRDAPAGTVEPLDALAAAAVELDAPVRPAPLTSGSPEAADDADGTYPPPERVAGGKAEAESDDLFELLPPVLEVI